MTTDDDEVDMNASVVITKDGGKLFKDEDYVSIIRIYRRHVTKSQRKFVCKSNKKCCFTCTISLCG